MSTVLRNLPYPTRKAIAYVSMSVLASKDQGRLDISTAEVAGVFRQLFDAEGLTEIQFLVNDILGLGDMTVIEMLSDLAQEQKFALKVFLVDLADGNAMRMICAAEILRRIGFVAPSPKKQKREDDEMDMSSYVRIADDGAIREDRESVFPVCSYDGGEIRDLRGCFDEWEGMDLCPGAGLIGYVRREEDTPEGKLCYVLTENMVVPVMDWGLECVDYYDYIERRRYNRIIAYDANHERITALRNTPRKRSSGSRKPVEKDGHKVIHYTAIRQERYENGLFAGGTDTERMITLEYESNGSVVTMSILGVMKPRKGKIEYDDGSVLRYRGIKDSPLSPDFYFEVETMDNNTIRRISLFQYGVEYRYTR